jgi:hypothetical protein
VPPEPCQSLRNGGSSASGAGKWGIPAKRYSSWQEASRSPTGGRHASLRESRRCWTTSILLNKS